MGYSEEYLLQSTNPGSSYATNRISVCDEDREGFPKNQDERCGRCILEAWAKSPFSAMKALRHKDNKGEMVKSSLQLFYFSDH
jgi:hypothetical protein